LLNEDVAAGPFGAVRRDAKGYGREDLDWDIVLMEASGFRLARREEVEGGPFGGGWYERQRWRVDYWLARVAPGLSAGARAGVLDRVAAETRSERSSVSREVVTVYVVMEATPLR
jgi:hypothetical protein